MIIPPSFGQSRRRSSHCCPRKPKRLRGDVMDLGMAIIAAMTGYLLGCISFARIISRLVAPEQDVTQTEMAVPGTEEKMQLRAVSGTAVSIHLGAKYGCLTALLDMLKV